MFHVSRIKEKKKEEEENYIYVNREAFYWNFYSPYAVNRTVHYVYLSGW